MHGEDMYDRDKNKNVTYFCLYQEALILEKKHIVYATKYEVYYYVGQFLNEGQCYK